MKMKNLSPTLLPPLAAIFLTGCGMGDGLTCDVKALGRKVVLKSGSLTVAGVHIRRPRAPVLCFSAAS